MKGLISRADLLAYLADHDDTELESIVECFGFGQSGRLQTVVNEFKFIHSDTGSVILQLSNDTGQAVELPSSRPLEPFLCLSAIQPSELVPEVAEGQELGLPQWFQDLPPLDTAMLKPSDTQPPEQQALVVWTKLWPTLHQILSKTRCKKRPDISRLVKVVADGCFPAKIPYLQQLSWTANAYLLLDYPDHLRLFGSDYRALLNSLKKLRGDTGLYVQQVKGKPGGNVSVGMGSCKCVQPWQMPTAGTPILIFGDAGLLDASSGVYTEWLDFGRKLQAAGCSTFLLTPLPARYLTAEVVNLFQCIHWDKGSNLQIITSTHDDASAKTALQADRSKVTQTLLPWLSPALLIEPELLRSVCRLLSWHEGETYDAGVEALCWTHTDVEMSSVGFHIRHDRLEHYRNELGKLAHNRPELTQQVYELFKQHHAHKYPTEFAEEVRVLVNTGVIEKDTVAVTADRHIKQLVKMLQGQADNHALRYYGRYFLQRQAQQDKVQQEDLSALWAILQKHCGQREARPSWLNAAIAAPFLSDPLPSMNWQVIQQGEQLMLTTPAMQNNALTNGLRVSRPLFSFTSPASLLVDERLNEQRQWIAFDTQLDLGLCLPLSQGKRRLHANGKIYVLSEMLLPTWADNIGRDAEGLFVEYYCLHNHYRSYWHPPTTNGVGYWQGFPPGDIGSDQYGLYVDLTIKNITQRFRWIEPGTFLMGSPESEKERDADEVQHQVTLTQGFWLADTTVTQSLWQAVMGNNPSDFSDNPKNPVEQVSWNDIQNFIQKLNTLIPNLQAKLPSEAQWEYACRAGTTTPFSFGDNITPEQVNYDGNYPYANGKKGIYRKKTVPVKSLPANPWGLYEMHGNVWEWCQDVWQEKLSAAPITDPDGVAGGDQAGVGRVVRGGSWDGYGRSCRSAYRFGFEPVLRLNDLGFRLLLGHRLPHPNPSPKGRGAYYDLP